MDRSQQNLSSPQDSGNLLNEVNTELALLALRSDQLRKQMTSLYYWNDAFGNRRVQQRERREHDERRRIVRRDGDRRATHNDRRLPVEVRCETLESELSTVLQRCRELADVRRKLSVRS